MTLLTVYGELGHSVKTEMFYSASQTQNMMTLKAIYNLSTDLTFSFHSIIE